MGSLFYIPVSCLNLLSAALFIKMNERANRFSGEAERKTGNLYCDGYFVEIGYKLK